MAEHGVGSHFAPFGSFLNTGATSLGLRWQQQDYAKYPGPAVIEFLDPIPPGLGRDEMVKQLGDAIRTHTDRLIAEGRAWDKANGVVRKPVMPRPAADGAMGDE